MNNLTPKQIQELEDWLKILNGEDRNSPGESIEQRTATDLRYLLQTQQKQAEDQISSAQLEEYKSQLMMEIERKGYFNSAWLSQKSKFRSIALAASVLIVLAAGIFSSKLVWQQTDNGELIGSYGQIEQTRGPSTLITVDSDSPEGLGIALGRQLESLQVSYQLVKYKNETVNLTFKIQPGSTTSQISEIQDIFSDLNMETLAAGRYHLEISQKR